MLELEGLGEYNNSGALLGLDGADDELLGALQEMNPIKRHRAMNKLFGGTQGSRGSRAEMEKHFAELPQHIKDGLVKGDLRLADTVIYSIKKVASKTVKLFETQDTKQIGTTSLSGARLAKNQALLVSGIFILAGVPVENNPDKIMAATYDKIEGFPAIATGEFSLKANKKIIIPDTGRIHDDILIEATVELGTMDGLNPNTHLYLGLHGTITTP
jgi:hypothetical protein